MTAAASASGFTAEPGTLRPRALRTIDALFRAPRRTLAAWRIARQIDDYGFHIVKLMHDMAALGLVERVGDTVGRASRWCLLVEGPVPR